MAQGIVVVRNEDISYKEMRAIAVDVMNVLSRCVQEDFDDYAIMRNFVARATECTQSILALKRAGKYHDAGILARHLAELFAMATHIYMGEKTDRFRRYSHIRYEKDMSRMLQCLQEDSRSPIHFLDQFKSTLNFLRKRTRRMTKEDKKWRPPEPEELFTSSELGELLGKGELAKTWYNRLFLAPSMLFVHITAYTGGGDWEFLRTGTTSNTMSEVEGRVGGEVLIYTMLVSVALSVIKNEDGANRLNGRWLAFERRWLSGELPSKKKEK